MKKLPVVFVSFLITSPLLAQEALAVLTLDTAIERVLSYNIDMQKTALDLSSALYAADHSWSTFFPTINLRASAAYQSNLLSNGGLQFKEANAPLELAATIRLQLNAGIPFAIQQLKLAAEKKSAEYESARRKLELSVTGTFYGLLALQQNLKLLEENLAFAERYKDRIYATFQAGMTGEIAYLRSQLEVETAKTALSTARITYEDRVRTFLALLGMDPDHPLPLEGAIQVSRLAVDAEELVREYLAVHPDILAKQQEIERLSLTKKYSDFTTYGPTIDFSWGLNLTTTRGFTDPLSVGIAINIPINPWIPGTKENQENRNTQSTLEKAQLDLKYTEQQTMLTIRLKAATLNNSWQSVENLRTRLNIAQKSYDLQERDFRAGAVGYSALENSQKDLYQAQYDLLQGEVSYWNAILDLALALNVDWKALVKTTLIP
ncbi:MAG: TolC family protein [Spirochaetaceae bacterium]|jgi:multidrug efflux system outer membrane protein|nr:TolC family protein [Spirochaetaceae bacterium]